MTQNSLANRAQFAASDPTHSSFVSANAGSGKTTVLTQRIARLLLRGVNPSRILCVTFTKAAAGEVQNRVFSSLAKWVLKSDDALRKELADIGETDHLPSAQLDNARRLFAMALETPGGLKIQTIHAFAASVLRRFPLEAGISPSFQEMSELDQNQLLKACVREIAGDCPDKLSAWKTLFPIEDYKGLLSISGRFENGMSAHDLSDRFEGGTPKTPSEIVDAFFANYDASVYTDFNSTILPAGAQNCFNEFLKLASDDNFEGAIDALRKAYLTATFTINANVQKRIDKVPNAGQLGAYVDYVAGLIDQFHAFKFYKLQEEFYQFGQMVSEKYHQKKDQNGWLDYEDLIDRCEKLLNQNNRLNWVMYRLDGGIEHILVDEAQDTNDSQWKIVDALAKQLPEAGNLEKSLFVVGDEKQSIFGFQGANPDIFLAKRDEYKADLTLHGKGFHIGEMVTSFRSSPLILNYVDAVFGSGLGQGLGNKMQHQAHFESLPGLVDIWPIYQSETEETEPLWPVGKIIPKQDAEVQLARDIAQSIHDDLKIGRQIFDEGRWRAVRPGDYLILTRSRTKIYAPLQKALQKLGVPIAGVDRMKLSEELAVKDVMALLRFAHAPFDEFSLACFLKSPIAGLDDQDIFKLMEGGLAPSLLEALYHNGTHYHHIIEMIEFVRDLVDYSRPYDIISKFILRFDVVEKLRSRLGDSVVDAIENLLDQALKFESQEAPSLVGFLRWFDQQDIDIKRDLENNDHALRVMTIHGAKGLEAPIVIVALTEAGKGFGSSMKVLDGMPVYAKSKSKTHPPTSAIMRLEEQRKAKEVEETRRLLYVAITRARSRLLICGLLPTNVGKESEDDDPVRLLDVYEELETALKKIGGKNVEDPTIGEVLRAEYDYNFAMTTPSLDDKQPMRALLSKFDAKPLDARSVGLSDVLASYVSKNDGTGRGAEFGDLVHHLIEYWPRAQAWPSVSEFFGDLVEDENFEAACLEVAQLYERFPEIKNALHEVEFSIQIPKYGQVSGRIDAIVVSGQKLRVIDFKSEVNGFENFADLPLRYQQQLAVYWHVIGAQYPNFEVSAEILWTSSAKRLVATNEELGQILQRFIAE